MKVRSIRAAVAGLAALCALLPSCATTGGRRTGRLFEKDQTYHYEALRSLGYAVSGGADVNEVLVALGSIKAGDAESWHAAWLALAERSESRAAAYERDSRGRGRSLLKASNYYRSAEFLLDGEDPRKLPTYLRGKDAFYNGLDAMGTCYERGTVPYPGGELETLFFPGDQGVHGSVLFCLVNGFDSIKEEAYFALGDAVLERGYSFLSYDGPGQGASIRISGIPLTHDWAGVNRAVLDRVLEGHPQIETVVLVGFSLGSVFATKAAADDPRIDFLVHYDIFHDFAESVGKDMPSGFRRRIFGSDTVSASTAFALKLSMKFSSEVDWAMRHGAWIMGTGKDYATSLNGYRSYNIRDDAPLVTCPVLLLVGERDHFVPTRMAELSAAAFSSSKDVSLIRYDEASGGAEHCQVGAQTLWTADLFEWLNSRLD